MPLISPEKNQQNHLPEQPGSSFVHFSERQQKIHHDTKHKNIQNPKNLQDTHFEQQLTT